MIKKFLNFNGKFQKKLHFFNNFFLYFLNKFQFQTRKFKKNLQINVK